ncbi:MAG TPA: DUF2304 domain-containing protein [Kofleriaceae bacterium]|nr:DUF2304 domain-containing protein [Kofleriaceae bacterium]
MDAESLWLKGGTWIFGGVCLVIAIVLLRLLFRERISLQGSMSYLAFLVILGLMAVFPGVSADLAQFLGFTLLSNFFFCTAIALLAILHLRALVMLSKVHLRSIALTQELAILNEKLERLEAALPPPSSTAERSAA